MLIGYSRVSAVAQDFQTQVNTLNRLGVDPTRIHIDSGFSGEAMTRDGQAGALSACNAGDTLVVPSMDRLASNALGVVEIITELGERGVILNVNGELYDPLDPMATMFYRMLTAVAEAESGWNSLRTREAMARPDVRQKLRGRRPRLTPEQDASLAGHLADAKMNVPEIAALFGISRSSVYRAMERHRKRERTTPAVEPA
ncbi:DNA invertase Pin-like site-specific DNA recombinase [Cryobacterium sp. MP_3.1]|uniref:recombinase family protein n=1 Tax=Cryobacterium sp. MP_3.1 TaxID=3071711 RepID=UPI002DFAD9C0|nr:DNA invertase Pin-like site-specific DNA recombinase [Cryobacterium sp. MP_3.1]